MGMKAQTTDGLIVTTGSEKVQFAVDEVKEVLCSDEKLTILKGDETSVAFAPADGWKIEFGTIEATAVTSIRDAENTAVEVYDTSGTRVQTTRGNELQTDRLPKGVYVVKVNGKSVKIKK